MASPPSRYSPVGLPSSPRHFKDIGTAITTPFCPPPRYSSTMDDRSKNDYIFANATIPLSPATTISRRSSDDGSLRKLSIYEPKKKSGIRKFFSSCFGSNAERRRRSPHIEEVKSGHWTEL